MKKWISVLLLVAMALCTVVGCGGQNQQDTEPLVVAMELAYPPFETKDDAGNPIGVSVDLAKAFGESIGREVVIENIAWDGLIPALQTGKVDMIISSMTITADREEVVDFSDPYANAMLALLTNKDSGITKAEEINIAGKVIGYDKSFVIPKNSLGKIDSGKPGGAFRYVKLYDQNQKEFLKFEVNEVNTKMDKTMPLNIVQVEEFRAFVKKLDEWKG